MKNFNLYIKTILVCTFLFNFNIFIQAQNTDEMKQLVLDVEKERPVIESLINQYSNYLLEGDSVSIAAMYAKDGSIGCKKGPEILSSAGSWIRSGIKNDSRHVTFKTTSLSAESDLLIETGKAEGRSDKGELKYTFRYLVVWKMENGMWKLYRDIGL